MIAESLSLRRTRRVEVPPTQNGLIKILLTRTSKFLRQRSAALVCRLDMGLVKDIVHDGSFDLDAGSVLVKAELGDFQGVELEHVAVHAIAFGGTGR